MNAQTEVTAQHNNIAKALAAAQSEMGRAVKQSTNPHFRSKYADLGNVMDACMEALTRHGISVIQPIRENEFGRSVVTVFLHESGETLENPVPLITGKNDMQGLGSAYTYARRYGLMGLAGIAPEDDDGNAAVASQEMRPREKSWEQTILDELPPNATQQDKARAIADAVIDQWGRKKSEGELSNEWDRRKAWIDRIEKAFPEIHREIVDAYENRMMEVTNNEVTE